METNNDVSDTEQTQLGSSNWRAWLGEDPRVAEDPSLYDLARGQPIRNEGGLQLPRHVLRGSDDEFD